MSFYIRIQNTEGYSRIEALTVSKVSLLYIPSSILLSPKLGCQVQRDAGKNYRLISVLILYYICLTISRFRSQISMP